MPDLQQAITAIKSGDKETGKQLLIEVIKADPNNESAWLWMTNVVSSDVERIRCLQNVLKINPNNENAKKGLAAIQQRQVSQQPPKVELPPKPIEPPPKSEPVKQVEPPQIKEQAPPPSPRPLKSLKSRQTLQGKQSEAKKQKSVLILSALALFACGSIGFLLFVGLVFYGNTAVPNPLSALQPKSLTVNEAQARLQEKGFTFAKPVPSKDDPSKIGLPCFTPDGRVCGLVYDQDGKIVGALQFLSVDNETASIDSVMAMIETIAPNWKEARDWVTTSVRKRGEISEQIQGDYKFSISTILIPMFSVSLVNTPVTDSLPGVDIPTSVPVPTETPLPTETPGPTPTPEILEFEGEGNDLKVITVKRGGGVFVGSGHRGESNFIVQIKDGNGNLLDIVANCIGDCEDKTVTTLRPGRYYLEIMADGIWFVVVGLP